MRLRARRESRNNEDRRRSGGSGLRAGGLVVCAVARAHGMVAGRPLRRGFAAGRV